MLHKLTQKQAEKTLIWVVDYDKLNIYQTSVYDYVREFAEETTTPNGIAVKHHIAKVKKGYEVRRWHQNGRYSVIGIYDKKTDADNNLYRCYVNERELSEVGNYDFGYTVEEAVDILIKLFAERNNIDIN